MEGWGMSPLLNIGRHPSPFSLLYCMIVYIYLGQESINPSMKGVESLVKIHTSNIEVADNVHTLCGYRRMWKDLR